MARDLFAQDEQQPMQPSARAPRNLFENAAQPEEQPGFWSKLPKNILTGLTHAGRNLANIPHDVAQMIEQTGQQMEPIWNQMPGPHPTMQYKRPISSYLPHDTTDYGDVWGLKGERTPVDKIVQTVSEYGPDVFAGVNALRDIIPHLTKAGATKKLRKAQQMAKDFGVNKDAFSMTPELIEDAKQFFPNTLQNRELFEKAKMGDYDAIFQLQSELGQLSGQRAKSWFNPEAKIKGRAGLQTQGKLLDEFTESLNKLGHEDIANLMTKGRQEFKRYMKFKPYRNALYLAGLGAVLPTNALVDIGKQYFKSKL